MSKKVKLISRVNYSVPIKIKNGETVMLSPKQKTKKEFYLDDILNLNPEEVMVVK